MSGDLRRFPFSVRPLHRESLSSYTSRVLAANFELDTLPADLTPGLSGSERDTAWLKILATKTGRDLHRLNGHPTGWATHPAGPGCEFCIDLVEARVLCTRCSKGRLVYQNRHFDDLVCLKHRRWVGLNTGPEGQVQVGPQQLTAAREYGRLVARHRLDLRMYLTLDSAITSHESQNSAAVFPKVVRLARTLTSSSFVSHLFNPAIPFQETLAFLDHHVEQVMGAPAPDVARRVWLYVRPTVAELRTAMMRGEPYKSQWPHDFPLDETIASTFMAPTQWQPFKEFLDASGDTPDTAMRADLNRTSARFEPGSPTDPGRYAVSKFVCEHGHHTQRREYLSGPSTLRPQSYRAPKCGVCANRTVERGLTDLESIAPDIAEQLDSELNEGLTAAEVPAKSNRKLFWRCPKNHSYQATPANRVLNKSSCPVCQNRVIIPGINCLSTTHPKLAAEWHPVANYGKLPTEYAAGSNDIITWLCPEGHSFRSRIWDRVHGKYCPTCTTRDLHLAKESLVDTHPLEAAQWHPSLNGGRTAADFTHGSKEEVWWLCDFGHPYKQRIERRTRGYKCSVCSRRTFVPNVNTLSVTEPKMVTEWHPYLNRETPATTMAIDRLFWWKCVAHGHALKQTVDHRRKSHGCVECPTQERLLRD